MPEKLNGTINIEELLPILDGISDAVFIDDRNGYCLWCNKSCEELYKISSYDVSGTSHRGAGGDGYFHSLCSQARA